MNDDEITRARAKAYVFLQKFFKSLDKETPAESFMAADGGFFQEEFERQILAVALRDVDNADNPITDVGELRLHLGAHDRTALIQAYVDFVEERSPLTKIRTQEDLQELIAVLGKEPSSSAFLSYCDTPSLRSIARDLAKELTALTSKLSAISGSSS